MIKKPDPNYYTQAKHWYTEVYESVLCSRDRYRLLSILLGVLLGLSLLLMISLLPLKHYFYRLISVNQQTGEVTELKELEQGKFTANWVVTRYFINQYIQNRHAYHFNDIKRMFNLVLAMSDPTISSEYTAHTIDTASDSPINLLGKDHDREVTVFSINQLNHNTALVRFDTKTVDRNHLSEVKTDHFQAVVKWDYQSVPGSIQDRDKNPLGFLVTYYQVSPVFSEN